jgi:hypothetical protein
MFKQLLLNKNKIATMLHNAAQWFGMPRIGHLNKAIGYVTIWNGQSMWENLLNSRVERGVTQGVFSSSLKNFQPVTSDVWHMYGVLNVDEKITKYTDCDKFVRQIF